MLDQSYSKKINDHKNGVASLTMPTGHAIRLMTAAGSASANGTELASGGSYVAGTGLALTWNAATTASPSVAGNVAASQTNMPATTIPAIEIWVSGPLRVELGNLTSSKTTAAGDTLSFAANAVTTALGG